MKSDELRIGDDVRVIRGLWKGTVGTISDTNADTSVVVIKDGAGKAAYAFKQDVEVVEVLRTI